jgi:hypothetical protein
MRTVKRESESARHVGPISRHPVNTDSIEAMTPETDKQVAGMFKNIEHPGQPGTVTVRLYKGQPIYSKSFFDGELATIPLSVARFINTRCQYTKHSYELDDKGNHKKSNGQVVQRYQFVSRDFM